MASAQTLADYARAERARRQSLTNVGATYTNEDVQGPYVPFDTESPPVPELLNSLQELADRLGESGADSIEQSTGPAGLATYESGSRIQMLEAFEAGSIEEIERLESELRDPVIVGAERVDLEDTLLDAQQILIAVRGELVQQVPPQSVEVPSVVQRFGSAEPDPRPVDGEAIWESWETAIAAQRTRVRDLEDIEVQRMIEITRLRELVTAPTGSQQARNQAQIEVGMAANRLADTRAALAQAQIALERMEADTPADPR